MISINEWWVNNLDKVNKPNGCTMTSYNNNDRSKNIKNTKIKPTMYMAIIIVVLLIIVVTIIIMRKAITLMKTATKTVIRIII